MSDETASVIADAIATGFDRIITKLTNVLARHDAELAEMRDDMLALSNRIEAVARGLGKTIDAVELLNDGPDAGVAEPDNALRKVEE